MSSNTTTDTTLGEDAQTSPQKGKWARAVDSALDRLDTVAAGVLKRVPSFDSDDVINGLKNAATSAAVVGAAAGMTVVTGRMDDYYKTHPVSTGPDIYMVEDGGRTFEGITNGALQVVPQELLQLDNGKLADLTKMDVVARLMGRPLTGDPDQVLYHILVPKKDENGNVMQEYTDAMVIRATDADVKKGAQAIDRIMSRSGTTREQVTLLTQAESGNDAGGTGFASKWKGGGYGGKFK